MVATRSTLTTDTFDNFNIFLYIFSFEKIILHLASAVMFTFLLVKIFLNFKYFYIICQTTNQIIAVPTIQKRILSSFPFFGSFPASVPNYPPCLWSIPYPIVKVTMDGLLSVFIWLLLHPFVFCFGLCLILGIWFITTSSADPAVKAKYKCAYEGIPYREASNPQTVILMMPFMTPYNTPMRPTIRQQPISNLASLTEMKLGVSTNKQIF